jgi:peptide/nickel transport system substrate-binding protein
MNGIVKKILVGSLTAVLLIAIPTAQAAPITAVYSNIAQTATLDPAIAYSSDGFVFIRNVYEGLIEYKPGSMDLQPLLASSWKVSRDGKTYTFNIRSGVTFHDGTVCDASAIAKGLQRIKDINQGPASNLTSVASILALDSKTLVITLKTADFTFLGKIPKLPIVSPTAVRLNSSTSDPYAKTWFASNASGTGPYKLDTWERNKQITIIKNDSYWRDFTSQTPTTVVLRVDPDIATAMQLLASGKVDFMGAVGPDDSALAEKNKDLQVIESPSYFIQMMPMNVTKGPLKDPLVREAIALAFDYKGMIDFYKGYAYRPTGPLPSGYSSTIASRVPPAQNLVRAKSLLAKAGYAKGFTISYMGLKGLSYEEFAGVLLESSMKKIGITVKQTYVPWPQMAAAYSSRNTAYDISFLNMSAFTDDASDFLSKSYASSSIPEKGGYNWSFYENTALDNDLTALTAISNTKTRLSQAAVLNKRIANLNLAIYVAQPKLAQPARAGWSAVYDSLDANYSIRFFYVKKIA